MAPIVLGYWDIRGLAQPIRLLLEYVGVEWEDKLYTIGGTAPNYDVSSWFDVKETLGFDFPNLPYLIDGDFKLCQSQAIIRHIARKHGLLGSTEEEAVRVDLVQEEWSQDNGPDPFGWNDAYITLCYSPDFAKKKDAYLNKTLPTRLKRFADFLGDRPYFAGNNITFVDFLMYEFLDQHKLLDPTCLKNYQALQSFVERIEKLDRIAAFLNSPRCIKYPLNAKMASFGG